MQARSFHRWLRPVLVATAVSCLSLASPVAAGADDPTTTVVASGNTRFGVTLTDAQGMTVYTWDGDEPGVSNCYDDCTEMFRPLIATTERIRGPVVNGAFRTTMRADGWLQVMFNNMPLYTFVGDEAPSQINGEAMDGEWWILGGDAVFGRS
jgi:predicted lipoprotein with Yx(FWY)xxD motif